MKIYILCLSVWMSVCLYPINVKTAEPIRPKFFVGPHMTPGLVYEWSKFQKFVSNKIRFSLNLKFRELLFGVYFYNVYKKKMFTIEIGDGREALLKPTIE